MYKAWTLLPITFQAYLPGHLETSEHLDADFTINELKITTLASFEVQTTRLCLQTFISITSTFRTILHKQQQSHAIIPKCKLILISTPEEKKKVQRSIYSLASMHSTTQPWIDNLISNTRLTSLSAECFADIYSRI